MEINNSLNVANSVIHNVTDEWHYPILSAYGFTPETTTQIGLVRKYVYKNKDGETVIANTGVHGDYWSSTGTIKDHGYWSSLKGFLDRNF